MELEKVKERVNVAVANSRVKLAVAVKRVRVENTVNQERRERLDENVDELCNFFLTRLNHYHFTNLKATQ